MQHTACAICLSDRFNIPSTLDCCVHKFCFTCIETWTHTASTCPVCKREISKIHPSKGKIHPVKRKRQTKSYQIDEDEEFARRLQEEEDGDYYDEEDGIFLFYSNITGAFYPLPENYELDDFVVPDDESESSSSSSSDEEDDEDEDSTSDKQEEYTVVRRKRKKQRACARRRRGT